jgi:hypothetical protein
MGIGEAELQRVKREFFSRRIDLREITVADSMVQVWLGELDSPPVRWRAGQREARRVRVPAFALRDLLRSQQFQ